jgi:hypothetical protein
MIENNQLRELIGITQISSVRKAKALLRMKIRQHTRYLLSDKTVIIDDQI